ncbi:MAG TPA: ComEA family DNA-binding protein [Bacillota bacterium]|nr:ComEA family DNA-binding protein [Bacillota bacterium]
MLWEKFKTHAVLIGMIVLIIIIVVIKRPFNETDELINVQENEPSATSIVDATEENETVIVDVKGAVKDPGVYEMSSQSRVNDVILKAGGLLEDADEHQVNFAEIVYDEMVIFVPTTDESEYEDVSFQQSSKVRVNQATTEELETLTGIGAAKAAAIINYRDEHGPFQSVDDLLNVPGIGQKTLDQFIDDIQIP